MSYKTRKDFEILSREDFELETDCYIIFQGLGGDIHDATGTIVSEDDRWILLTDSVYPAIPKQLIKHISEV